ncbi:MAG: DUF3641 domain-containing protein [Nitrospira sp.]|nr:DUF3641 domain-containing protein [Nitrospira sp.]
MEFNHLYTITNMPVSRFLEFLVETRELRGYMERLANAFNPAAAAGVMCRSTLSVGWDGTLYDCDFNQMLELRVDSDAPSHIRDFEPATPSPGNHHTEPLLRVHGGSRIIVRRCGDLIGMPKPPPTVVRSRVLASSFVLSMPRQTHHLAAWLDRRFARSVGRLHG